MDRQSRKNGIDFRQGMRSNETFVCSVSYALQPGQTSFVSR
jgi:hypothetical protein